MEVFLFLIKIYEVNNSKLKEKDKWHLHHDPDYQVRFAVFKWLVDRLNKVIVY